MGTRMLSSFRPTYFEILALTLLPGITRACPPVYTADPGGIAGLRKITTAMLVPCEKEQACQRSGCS